MMFSFFAILASASAAFAATPGFRNRVKDGTTSASGDIDVASTITATSTLMISVINTAVSTPSAISIADCMSDWESQSESESDDEDEDEDVAPTNMEIIGSATRSLTAVPTAADESTVLTCWGTDWQNKSDMTIGLFTGTYLTTVPVTDRANRCFRTYMAPRSMSTSSSSVSSTTPVSGDPMMTTSATLSIVRPSSALPTPTSAVMETHSEAEYEDESEPELEVEDSTTPQMITHVVPIPAVVNQTSLETVFKTQTILATYAVSECHPVTATTTLTLEMGSQPTAVYQPKKVFRPQHKVVQPERVDDTLDTCVDNCVKN